MPNTIKSASSRIISKHKALLADLHLAAKGQDAPGGWKTEEEYSWLLTVDDRLMLKLAEAPCANNDEFFIKAAHILECLTADVGEPRIDHDFGPVAIALREYLQHRPGV
jgi:hypothetical protein